MLFLISLFELIIEFQLVKSKLYSVDKMSKLSIEDWQLDLSLSAQNKSMLISGLCSDCKFLVGPEGDGNKDVRSNTKFLNF